jgi:hypothetical protein
MSGPYDEDSILRAVRVACTPTIDGCEKGPHQLGVATFDDLRQMLRGPKWQELAPAELPASLTHYDSSALAPVSGCCTTDDTVPAVDWGVLVEGDPSRARDAVGFVGRLATSWNAHPSGSIVKADHKTLSGGFSIVDLPPGTESSGL